MPSLSAASANKKAKRAILYFTIDATGVHVSGDCEFCFACIQNCPQKAIKFAKSDDPLLAHGEVNPDARYRNEHVSLADIRLSNSQHL